MTDGTVRGCVHAAATHLRPHGGHEELLEPIERIYQDHRAELTRRDGTVDWRMLARLWTERQGDQVSLFEMPAHVPSFDDLAPDPLTVTCEHCGAGIGQRCVRPSEHNVFGGGVHAIRRADAERHARETR